MQQSQEYQIEKDQSIVKKVRLNQINRSKSLNRMLLCLLITSVILVPSILFYFYGYPYLEPYFEKQQQPQIFYPAKKLPDDVDPLEYFKDSPTYQFLINNIIHEGNSTFKDQRRFSSNDYPTHLPKLNITDINPRDKGGMNPADISAYSDLIAKQYIMLGLNQPSQQLIQKQKKYYEEKYEGFSSLQNEFPICVVIMGYNNVQNNRYQLALNSVFRQDYTNYHVVYIDDASTDGTGALVEKYVLQKAPNPEKWQIIRNRNNQKSMKNHYIVGKKYCQQQQIYFMAPDGDDGLIGKLVLKLYNYFFQKNDIWVAWGNYMLTSTGYIGTSHSMSERTKKRGLYRDQITWYTSHPKAFYTKLWNLVRKIDLIDQYLAKQNNNPYGQFYKVAQDLAMMYPMIQMARLRSTYVPQVTYLYVDGNSGSESVLYGQQIMRVSQSIQRRKKYDLVVCLFQKEDGSCPQARDYILEWYFGNQ